MSNDHGTNEKTAKGILMTNRDKDPIVTIGDVPAALGLLTRLPIRVDTDRATARGAAAAWAYPIAGLIVGGLAALVAIIALALGLPNGAVALLVIATQVLFTGAMHEDGLADAADGFWGGWDAENRLHIMKDSAIGTYGVLALVLVVGLRWTAVSALLVSPSFPAILIAVAALSRASMPSLMHMMPYARDNGLSRKVGRPARPAVLIATALSIITALVLTGAMGIPLVMVTLVVGCICAAVAYRKIRGQTGDVLGATQQLTETAALIAAAALLAV